MNDGPTAGDMSRYAIGENLYGLSIHEIEARIEAYTAEIERLRGELARKSRDKDAADALFS